MKKYTFLLLPLFILGVTACQPKAPQQVNDANEKLVFATLFVQQAAEFKALNYQAYNIGKFRLDQILNENKSTKKLAVVVDIDETVLDNSPFEAKSILEKSSYPAYWKEWCNLAKAESISGAQEFLSYAAEKGVETFYISNRKIELYDATLANLISNGFPHADSTHLLLRTSTSDKEPRRDLVRENYDIVLLFGDNLGDFSNLFDNKGSAERSALVEEAKAEFGSKFIVLPNPMYGAWDAAMFDGIETNNKDSVYKARLKSF
ncbi:MAG: 5'-nucleotidase, lipoprotein e(P4) family [Bacteroidales bacterium]|nr:5'-nucleotidase, lipoprotein e(P4) family [Bacteroidales bacterium]